MYETLVWVEVRWYESERVWVWVRKVVCSGIYVKGMGIFMLKHSGENDRVVLCLVGGLGNGRD